MVVMIVAHLFDMLVFTSEDVSSVAKSGASTGEDVSTSTDHIWSESKLLAVEDEEISVFVECPLNSSATVLEVLNS